ncbi:hypothetical protein BAE44_0007876 [Dichanthelium oligosanthes]|uniref:Uncharacterized protein n=1 Tax=Dichanthelium oligosanthes TaxID=888268 RepID=A0A1E5W179_9POAL|nr:hypothetical protein BAE44_0007876 [Dichanthelium oligosanthes]
MASSSALKLAAACMLLLCVGSDLARPALASSPSPPPSGDEHQDQRAAAGELLLRGLVEHDLAEELGLLEQRGGNAGDICPSACQTCLIMCAVTCVLIKEPIACFANCTVSSSCLGKTLAVAPLPAVRA